MLDINNLLTKLHKELCEIAAKVKDNEKASTKWSIVGNSNVDEDNFIGTIIEEPFIIKTNDHERLRVLDTGNIGINTINPTTTLDVNGILRIRGGNPATGRVLTSDANGVASWQVVSGGGSTYSFQQGLSEATGIAKLGGTIDELRDIAIDPPDGEVSGLVMYATSIPEHHGNPVVGIMNIEAEGTKALLGIQRKDDRFLYSAGIIYSEHNYDNNKHFGEVINELRYKEDYTLESDLTLTHKKYVDDLVNLIVGQNGLTSNGTRKVLLGQSTGELNDPAKLLSDREIPMNGFGLSFIGASQTVRVSSSGGITSSNSSSTPLLFSGTQTGTMTAIRGVNLSNNSGAGISLTVQNDVGAFGQLFLGSSTHSALPNIVQLRSTAQNGLLIDSEISDIIFSKANSIHPVSVSSQYGRFIYASQNFTLGAATDGNARLYVVNALTGSQNASTIYMQPLWNTTGTPTLLKANITDTASNVASLLLDLQVSNDSKIRVDKAGNTFIKGNLGLGVTPVAKLDIDGLIRIRQGIPGVGKVLTSDANGLATWETPTGGGGGGTTYTFQDGIEEDEGIVNLGGPVNNDIEWEVADDVKMSMTGNVVEGLLGDSLFHVTNNGISPAIRATNSSTGHGLIGEALGSGIGVYGSTATGTGVYGVASGVGIAVLGQSVSAPSIVANRITTGLTNTVETLLRLQRSTDGTAANGIGTSIEFQSEMSTGVLGSTIWLDAITTDVTAATLTSRFRIRGKQAGSTDTLLTLEGSGSLNLAKYGDLTFIPVLDAPTSVLGVDINGNVLETIATNGLNLGVNGIKWGGALVELTTITGSADAHRVLFTATTVGNAAFRVQNAGASGGSIGVYGSSASADGHGVYGFNSVGRGLAGGGSIGVLGSGTDIGVYATSNVLGFLGATTATNGRVFEFSKHISTTNDVTTIGKFIRKTTGTAANGIGLSVDFEVQTSDAASYISNQMITKWTNATTALRTSEFSLTGVSGAVTATLLALSGNGQLRLHKYGVGAFSAAAVNALGVDIDGRLVETSLTLPSSTTKIQFKVGAVGAPAAGTTSYDLGAGNEDKQTIVFRGGIPMWEGDPEDGDTYMSKTGNIINFSDALGDTEKIIILTL